MKIMHVLSSAAAGGAEIYVRDLAIHMSKQGHNIFLLFLDRSSEAGRDQAFEDDYLRQLDYHNICYDFIGQSARRKPWRGVAALKRICHDFSPDVVHTHLYYAAIFSLLVPSIKVVYTHHNIRLGASRYIYKLLDMKVLRYVGICYACKKMLESVSRRRVVRIDNGVDVERLLPKESHSNHDNSLVVVSVGRLSEQKNLSLLIDALALVSVHNFTLKIAGEGPQRDSLEAQVESLGLSSNVEFLGNVQGINALLYSADIFVMSSEWEGLPIAQIEATLTGLPVVVTNVGGCAEVVHRSVNGLVVDDRVPDEFARQLDILLTNHLLRQKLSENALSYSSDYRIDVAANKHLDMYKEIVGNAIT
ncbi:MAG: glycosyltransferase family 1 protein [Halomonas sp.]|nr:glycosyltransferase [Halomonas sp.]TVP45506.1 MAG: glycosyltransferase family 1 protein [Halomonas sp.]